MNSNKASDWLISFNTNYQDQVVDILETPKSVSTKAQKICITGGKGGVGKTSVSLKLAKELAHKKQKVLLIDCDYNLSNTAINIGIPITN